MSKAIHRQIVVIGNGIAGVTAARNIRKRSDDEIILVSEESDHFFSRTALMYIYMGHLRFEDTKPYDNRFWLKNRIQLRRARVAAVDSASHALQLTHNGESSELSYDVLIVASGSKSNKFGWPGQDLAGVQGLYHLQDLQAMERYSEGLQRAVIVGGGLIGVEMAEMFLSRNIPVTFLVREDSWMRHILPEEESMLVCRRLVEHGIDLRLSTELKQIEGDAEGRVSGIVTKEGDEVACQFVGLTVGVSPRIDFLEGSGIELDRGVLVDARLQTNVPDVYAIGDCAQLRQPSEGRRPIEALWYVGRRMGETVARNICGEPADYAPGVWFNSAKFFDLEYQVYGRIPPNLDDATESLYWQDVSGMKSIRINFDRATGVIQGANLMGVRHRHETWDRWVREQVPIRFVLENLGAANFDPEFTRQFESEVLAEFNQLHPENPVRLKRRRGLGSVGRMWAEWTSGSASGDEHV